MASLAVLMSCHPICGLSACCLGALIFPVCLAFVAWGQLLSNLVTINSVVLIGPWMGCDALGAWETILVVCLQLVLYAALQVPYPGQAPTPR